MNTVESDNSSSISASGVISMTTIRYLGQYAEALLLGAPSGCPDDNAVKIAGRCCDRIEHIAQSALDGMSVKDQMAYLLDDALFMRSLFRDFEKTLESGLPFSYPSHSQLTSLIASLDMETKNA